MTSLSGDAITKLEVVGAANAGQPTGVKSVGVLHPVGMIDIPATQKVFVPMIPIVINRSIPDISTKNGNLLNDRFDKNTLWYLPVFNLISGTDSSFSFMAIQDALPNQNGDPFYVADLKFNIHKDLPSEASAAKSANPALNLKEIALQLLTVTLSIAYSDAQGNATYSAYPGTILAGSDGNFMVDFPAVIGDHVVLLYENLKMTGTAQIALSATYSAWRPVGTERIFFIRPYELNVRPGISPALANLRDIQYKTLRPQQPPVSPSNGFNENQIFYQKLGLDKKFDGNEYQLSYKIKADSAIRPIIDVTDLKNLNGNQTEFSELKTIDLTKYPSISSLYIGVISRVIIVVPRCYAIARNSLTCSAICLASVDTTPGSAGNCMFQFQFELTPAADPIDFIMLLKEIQQNNDLKNYALKFPQSLNDKSPSVINSVFTTDTSYTPAATPQNFFLTTTIVDKPGQSAIVNANLFIQQLCKMPPGSGLGTINLKLDDNFQQPVSTTVALSLPDAISVEGISWSVDANSQSIILSNSTSFDFLLQRYSFCSDAGIGDAIEVNLPIATGQSANIPLIQNARNLSLILDYIEKNTLVDRTNITRYMEIKTQDAQNVQFYIGVDSAQVKYQPRNIKQIDIQIHLTNHPEINIPLFSVMALNTADGTKIMLPLQFAVSSLDATLSFAVSYLDSTVPVSSFTKQNDFITNPVFDLMDGDLPS